MKRTMGVLVLLAVATINIVLFQNFSSSTRNIYISMNGSDESGDGSIEKPFQTPKRAIALANLFLKDSNVAIRFLDSQYFLKEPIEINSDNFQTANHNGHKLYFLGLNNGKQLTTTLSGGRKITTITPVSDGKTWRFQVGPHLKFRQAYVNGRRAIRAKTNAEQDLGISSACDSAKTPESCWRGFRVCHNPTVANECKKSPLANINSWDQKDKVEIVMKYQWMMPRCLFGAYQVANTSPYSILTPIAKSPTIEKDGDFCWDLVSDSGTKKYPSVLWLENAMELLDAPDEWYYHYDKGYLYFKPRPNEPLGQSDLVVPQLDYLARIKGTSELPVKNIVFKYLAFSHSAGLTTNDSLGAPESQKYIDSEYGYPERQANIMPNGYYPRGAVLAQYAENLEFSNNVFSQLGGSGLEFTEGVQFSTIARNIFHDISSGAIRIGHTRASAFKAPQGYKPNKEINVDTNLITNIGVEYWGAVGIFAGYVDTVRVRNNTLTQLPYTGISFGYGWGSADYNSAGDETPTPAKNNSILANLIENHVLKLNDGGGIYTLGKQPGTLIQHNVIRQQKGDYGALYLDICSSGITAKGNLIYANTRTFLAKGFNNLVEKNFWEVTRKEDLYQLPDPEGARCLLAEDYLKYPNNISTTSNIKISEGTLSNYPSALNILNSSGLPSTIKTQLKAQAMESLKVQCTLNGITLHWPRVPNADKYLVRVDLISNNQGSTWYYPNSGDYIFDDIDSTNIFIKLNKGNYRVWVHAANTLGFGEAKGTTINCQ